MHTFHIEAALRSLHPDQRSEVLGYIKAINLNDGQRKVVLADSDEAAGFGRYNGLRHGVVWDTVKGRPDKTITLADVGNLVDGREGQP